MDLARQWIVCCTAMTLVFAAMPVPAAEAVPAPVDPIPCHADGMGPSAHDSDCATGCDSAPVPGDMLPDWAPSPARGSQDLPDPIGLLSVPDLVPRPAEPATANRRRARAPPALRGTTPIARHDVLRD
jgi:hypothetical protein